MSEILLKASEARDSASQVTTAANAAKEEFDSLKSKLQSLADSFRGATAQAFNDRYEEWHSSALQMTEALDGLGQFLNEAANIIEGVDSDLASKLRG